MTSVSGAPRGHFSLLYFASASSYTGKDYEAWPAPLPLSKLFTELESKYPGIQSRILDSCLITVNLGYVDPGAGDASGPFIEEFDEVAIIPPVSSG
ncbi:Molybdenum cofactor synthesis protein 2A [Metarhizium rileyi]|uniref:Molybdopterin synthase sulfur carrier subunit n=1 Tax=Metarhizium rileyi (strain RCEF 4871) TaxID=1649241 RepID=A0A162JKC4_METRR|nr:Molybdenum cofactor synthesis protein 2A [Metarhizium rileyi RCEF 4871]